MSNDSYSPSYIVRTCHNILHLDQSMHKIDSEFNITYSSQLNDYTKSLVAVPSICMALGLLAVVLFQLSLCSRICIPCCRCIPKIDAHATNGLIDENEIKRAAEPKYRYMLIIFLLFGLFTLLAVQILIFGNSYLTTGVNSSLDSIDYVNNLFTDLNTDGDNLLNFGKVLYNDLNSAGTGGCAAATSLSSFYSSYKTEVDDYLSYVSPVPDKVSIIHDDLELWGNEYRASSVWVMYGIFIFLLVLYFIGIWAKNKIMLQLSIGLTEIILLLSFIMIGVVMVIVMILSDFCIDPILYTTRVVPRSIYNVTMYYTQCVGVNPVLEPLSGTVRFVNQYNTYITTLYNTAGSCYHNTYLSDSLVQLQLINSTVQNITLAASCSETKTQVTNLLEDSLCGDGMQGIYVIWLGEYLTTVLLFICTILIAFLYQYYGSYWTDADVVSNQRNGDYMEEGYGDDGHVPMQTHPTYVEEVSVATPVEMHGRESAGSSQYTKTLPT